MKLDHVYIRFDANQIGLRIEASQNGKEWSAVEFQNWKTYESQTVKQYSTCIDTDRQKREYLADINNRGIRTTLIHNPQ